MDEFELFKQREADLASEFERLAKECFCGLNQLKPSPADALEDSYLAGYSKILNSSIESIQAFFDEDNLRKDYPKAFGEMRTRYYKMYLTLKDDLKKKPKTEFNEDFNDGAFNAARDLYKSLDRVVESAAEFGLKQLHKHQQQREQHGRSARR